MSEYRIASRYSKSLMDLAVEKNQLEDIKADMELLSKVCKENREFVLMLNNPILESVKKAAVIRAVFKDKVQEMTSLFFDIVSRKHRESVLPEMAKVFKQLYNEHKGIITAEVTTTFKLDDSLRPEVIKIVKEISGKEVELNEKVDEALIGGFLIRVGDKQIDETIQSKLNDLRRELTRNQYIKQI
ncbi:ATP synthase subunit delta [Marivirga tractuosa]|uniref:ATP synthase subunit delta n=1 Tax=Marivirga tractuosa (strain ATCC 23168 / DSM 4126 / NBRC 15989 / NCIMB 1408 / VKM B-1430 / H-43) TaxID=643867 RepID=E4TNY4_MARTH|nr:ATP synthase F1 subunit delta [Marivirga tractuosa]ADR22548.1 ATP synthase F1, delta subunit [Marivirga tractuosa DSM 4126]BDD16781.1 ATP synthase subunit delta [Marivirga tractuosa]